MFSQYDYTYDDLTSRVALGAMKRSGGVGMAGPE